MKPLTIEIHGTGTHNRGAELMAIAIAKRMRATFSGVRLVVPPTFGDSAARARHGFLTTTDFPGRIRSRITRAVLNYSSKGIQNSLGLVPSGEIDVVLDASGFAFSDQWGPRPAKKLITKMKRSTRSNQLLILLPQAFGPFENPKVAASSRDLFERATLICARDTQSYSAASKLGYSDKLRLYPDFTLTVDPWKPNDLQLPESFAAIVPNYRMMDKTSNSTDYLHFLVRAIDLLKDKGLNPVFVLHDADEDRQVLEKVREERSFPVIEHSDPRVLKGILGQADLVIGSRFHALVSALSQGISCIGVGWSHKYVELFRDFDAGELLLHDLGDADRLTYLLESLNTAEKRATYGGRISAASEVLKLRTLTMWEEVETLIKTLCSNL